MRTFCLFSALALVSAAPSWAADRAHMNRCSDATTELRGATAPIYKDRDIEPTEIAKASPHLTQHLERFNRAKKFLDSAGPWDPKDPDLRECVGLLSHELAYVEATSKKIQLARALAAQEGPVLEAAKGDAQHHGLLALATVLVSEKTAVFEHLTAAQAKAQVDSLAPVDAACQKAFPNAAKTPPEVHAGKWGTTEALIGGVALPSKLSENSTWLCYVAAHRAELVAKALLNVSVDNHDIAFGDVLKPGDAWNGSAPMWIFELAHDEKPWLAKRKVALAAWYKAFGVAMPADPFPGLAEEIGQIRKAVMAAAERNVPTPGTNHDKALEGGVRGVAAKLQPKVTTLATWLNEAGWTFEQNKLGVPIDRYRSGYIVYRVTGDPWCLQQPFTYTEPHIGGGKYQSSALEGMTGAGTAVKCP